MTEELIKRLAIFVDHFKFADDSKRGEAMSLLTELSAIKSQPVPVEPVRFMWRSHGMVRNDEGLFIAKTAYDSLKQQLQVAQQERDEWERKAGQYMDERDKAEAEIAEQPALQVWKNKETGKHLFEWLIAPDKFSDGAKFYTIDRARSKERK